MTPSRHFWKSARFKKWMMGVWGAYYFYLDATRNVFWDDWQQLRNSKIWMEFLCPLM